jgi:4-amino-4-deoxy-L-arabinose transferase-like glycosyltransferase
LFRLGHQSLWVDEAFTWGMAQIGHPMSRAQLLEDIHGPLYSLMLHGWGAIAGDSEWALRFPAAVLGVLLVPLMGAIAWTWLGSRTAVPALWLTACSPFLVWYGQEARNYALAIFCACASALALLSLRQWLSFGGIVSYVASAVAGLLSNFSFAFLFPLHLVWWLGEPGRRVQRFVIAACAMAVLVVAISPWFSSMRGIWSVARLVPGGPSSGEVGAPAPALRGTTTFHPGAVPFALHSFAVGYTLGPPLRELRIGSPIATLRRHLPEALAVTAVFGPLGVLGLLALRRRRRLLQGLLWLLVPMLLLSYAAIANVKVFHPRYVAIASPAFLLVIAAALADLRPRARTIAALAIAALWIVSLQHHYFVPRYGKEDVRSAAQLVEQRGRPGERVIAANTEAVLLYYYRGPLPVKPFWIGYASDPNWLANRVEAELVSGRGTWVVLSRPEDLDPHGEFARYLDSRHPEAERFQFEGVRVWHLESKATPGAESGPSGT